MNAKALALFGFGALAVGYGVAPAQPRPLGAPAPAMNVLEPGMGLPVPAPLVAAKVVAAKEVRVTAFPGTPLSRMYDGPAIVGLRPGYKYRFELTNLPFHPDAVLYPEVEVRGVLVPRPGMKYMDYPIPLTFSQSDIDKALRGAVVTKVIYLEDPEKALPAEVGRDTPVEMPDATESAAVKAALAGGRLMAIVRFGNRKPTADELRASAVEGTILLPGEKYLKAPVAPPQLPILLQPMYDPLLGPKGPKEECLVNGDDKVDPLGIGPGGALGGLNPTDVGVEYTLNGKRKVTTSNVVCICSPRFMVRRAELLPIGFDQKLAVAAHVGAQGTGFVRDRHAPAIDIGTERPTAVTGGVRPGSYVGKVGTAFFIGSERPFVVGQVSGVKVTGVVVEPEQLTAYGALCPLTVTKSVDPSGPKEPGEIVTITIKYSNTGNKPVDDVVISDSLSARLGYVEGSAQSDRPANFTTSENDVGSVVVRWELPGTLLPGQTGTVKFKAKVR